MRKSKTDKDNVIDYGLIEIETIRKERINKILILTTLGIVVIASASIAGILIAESKREDEIKTYIAEQEVIPEVEPTPKVPVYSEEAKVRMANIYNQSEGEEKIAYLTFDDGPSSNITPQILEILRNEGIKATFFVLGSRVEANPEIVKQEYEEGHYIANRGFTHNYAVIYASPINVLNEYNETEGRIKAALGIEYNSHLFRFPRRK